LTKRRSLCFVGGVVRVFGGNLSHAAQVSPGAADV